MGGAAAYWEQFGSDLHWDRVEVCTLNLDKSDIETTHPKITSVVGDARHAAEFHDLSFDVVHSKSVIEHVGRWDDMAAMAKEIRRLAPAIWSRPLLLVPI